MAIFAYRALNAKGNVRAGWEDYPDAGALKTALISQGLYPTEVREVYPRRRKRRRRRLGPRDVTLLIGQLSTLTNAGIPTLEAIHALKSQADSSDLTRLLEAVQARLEKGGSLADALGEHPALFGNLYCSLVRAAELGGFLGDTLKRLEQMREREEELRTRVRAALTYPVITLLVMGLATGIILTFVLPSFCKMLLEMNLPLPGPTRFLMDFSSGFRAYWPRVLAGLAVAALLFRRAIRTRRGRRWWDGEKLASPIFGPLMTKIVAARFSRTLSNLLKSGVRMQEALVIVKDLSENVVVTEVLLALLTALERGQSMSGPLERSGVFPPLVSEMIALGENSGGLEEMLGRIADRFDAEVKLELDNLVALINPLMTLAVGLLVGGLVLSLVMPMAELGNAIPQ